MSAASPSSPLVDSLADPALRRSLDRFLRRRLPAPDVDDAIQSILCAAFESRRAPTDREELRKWLTGIARHTIAAHFARASRERVGETPELAAGPPPHEAASLLRWVEREASSSAHERVAETLDWMARESDGERLEEIAADAKVPAPRVRQRVSRLRRWMKARWIAQLVGVLVLGGLAAWWLASKPHARSERRIADAPSGTPSVQRADPIEEAGTLRRAALEACDASRFDDCLDALDRARSLDPAGDSAPTIVEARARAVKALTLTPVAPSPPKPIHVTLPVTPIDHSTGTSSGTPGASRPH